MTQGFQVTVNDAAETIIIDDTDKNKEVVANVDETKSNSGKN